MSMFSDLTDDLQDQIVDLKRSLHRIASGTPAVHTHDTGEHPCAQCGAMILEAREALGYRTELGGDVPEWSEG